MTVPVFEELLSLVKDMLSRRLRSDGIGAEERLAITFYCYVAYTEANYKCQSGKYCQYCKQGGETGAPNIYCPVGYTDTDDEANGLWRKEEQPLQSV
ncbi:hypothetical protein NQ314_002109, partial [Rhamnusium bicolor]